MRLLLGVEEASKELGIRRSTLFTLIAAGALRSVKIGRRRLIPGSALEAYVEKLQREGREGA